MRLLVVAKGVADGRLLPGPVDGYFLHGSFCFSSGRDSVRMRHLAVRPAVSATHLAGEELAATVHTRASSSGTGHAVVRDHGLNETSTRTCEQRPRSAGRCCQPDPEPGARRRRHASSRTGG
jgi:hypothetical protein